MCESIELQINGVFNCQSRTWDLWLTSTEDESKYELLGAELPADAEIRRLWTSLIWAMMRPPHQGATNTGSS